MCGIAYAKRFDNEPANNIIKSLYFDQKTRGKEGFGFLTIGDKVVYNRTKWEHEILGLMSKNKGSEILFHHRNPTSTANTIETAHPILADQDIYKYNYYLTHNGIINNAMELYYYHKHQFGLKYATDTGNAKLAEFNDSEALLHELALFIENKKDKPDFRATGSMAFILVQTDKEGTPLNLFFGRNEANPLEIQVSENALIIASENRSPEAEQIEPNKLWMYSYRDGKIYHNPLEFKRYYHQIENPHTHRTQTTVHTDIVEQGTLDYDPEDTPIIEYTGSSSREDLDEGLTEKLGQMTEEAIVTLKSELTNNLQIVHDSLTATSETEEIARLRQEEWEISNELRNVEAEIKQRGIVYHC